MNFWYSVSGEDGAGGRIVSVVMRDALPRAEKGGERRQVYAHWFVRQATRLVY